MYKPSYHFVESEVYGGNNQLAKKFGVRGTPNLIFLDAKGEQICRTFGFRNADDGVRLHKFVQKASAHASLRASQQPCGRAD